MLEVQSHVSIFSVAVKKLFSPKVCLIYFKNISGLYLNFSKPLNSSPWATQPTPVQSTSFTLPAAIL